LGFLCVWHLQELPVVTRCAWECQLEGGEGTGSPGWGHLRQLRLVEAGSIKRPWIRSHLFHSMRMPLRPGTANC